MKTIVAICTSIALASPAMAADLLLYPVQTGVETVRFHTGVPTLTAEGVTGAVQITPLPFDHGHVTFGLAFYNKGKVPTNIGIENITSSIQGVDVAVLSSDELQKRAKSRATWSAIGVAVLAGAAAAAASNAHTTQTYRGHLSTPRGSYSWVSSYRDNSLGVLGATAAVAGGTAGIVGIQNRLDYTLSNLATEIVQTTTVDPDSSYGGTIEIEKSAQMKAPYDVKVVVSFNGESFPFVFRATQPGQNLPAPYKVIVAAASAEPATTATTVATSTPAAATVPAAATTPAAGAIPTSATIPASATAPAPSATPTPAAAVKTHTGG